MIIDKALESKAWPFLEAEKLLQKLKHTLPQKGYVLFETGYGPSGLPHIGTFGEVVRTTMIRKAFEYISGMPTRLFCVSDDLDGMRKIPDTIPNKEDFIQYMDLPLTRIPDPFGTHKSFGHHMNARLCNFLDTFDFEYEFFSASECYKNGIFNEMLLKVLKHYDEIMDIMLPTLGPERRATYSPFLPICPTTGKVLQVPIIDRDAENGIVTYKDIVGQIISVKVTDGFCKLQWKPDFGMRWAALDVDFEMYGKDHLINGPIYSKICAVLDKEPPHQMFYELFLDVDGKKISKSKGNGLTIEEWLHYAPRESLALFMYMSPQRAKKLYFEVVPKSMDDYIAHLNAYHSEQDQAKRFANPVYHIHNGNVPAETMEISYSLLLNLVSACNTDNEDTIWKYIANFLPHSAKGKNALLDRMVRGAINYYKDFVKPKKQFREASTDEKDALHTLISVLKEMKGSTAAELQNAVYDVGKKYDLDLKLWFQALYEILLGASQGPRFGSFIALYGTDETIALIQQRLQ